MVDKNKIVLDVETQKSFQEVGGRNLHLLKISVVGIYDYARDEYLAFEENEMAELEKILRSSSLIIGFNIKGFDFPVLQPYLSIPMGTLPALDLMEEIVRVIGHRVGLDSVAAATLGEGKTGNGLDAIRFFREGRIDELKEYCLHDVQLTKQIYDYALRHGQLSFRSKYSQRNRAVPLAQIR